MTIKRIEAGSRMSQAVIHGDTVYLAGQVAQKSPGKPVGEQTKEILGAIDRLLGEAGSDKSKLLSAQIWLADIATFNEMNEVWDAWLSPGNAPARATVESKLASPQFTVEIMVIAAR
jgi:enamine deaminase RidA (YjgF/YER057c/UK114 family)